MTMRPKLPSLLKNLLRPRRAKKPRKTVEEAEQPADEMTAEEAGDAVAAWSVDAADPAGDDGANDNLE